MNNAIRAIVRAARWKKIEPFLVFNGYRGLYENKIEIASNYDVDSYINQGGTFIGTARFPEFTDEKVRQQAKKNLQSHDIDALIVIGGDGSYKGAQLLNKIGVKTIVLPGTIDNDIASSEFTIGYPTALQTIVENIDRVRDTMNSHHRVAIVEVMGHGCGDLALYSGLATGAEIIITNEEPLANSDQENYAKIAEIVKKQFNKGKRSVIAVVSEKIFSNLETLSQEVEKMSGYETRAMSFSHIQRGGNPTAFERINASRMGLKAVTLLAEGNFGLAIGIINNKTVSSPISEALLKKKDDRSSRAQKFNQLNQS